MYEHKNIRKQIDTNLLADRARGALWGLAVGDALGMPTQSLSPEQIKTRHGKIIELTAATNEQPIAPDMPAGSVTDDTEQALIVAKLLLAAGGTVNTLDFAKALIDWEKRMVKRGSQDLLGPSTKAALESLQKGANPLNTGKRGTTNGAAMRIAPVAICHRPGDRLRQEVINASIITHNTNQGLAAALAVATAISELLEGATLKVALDSAIAEAHWADTQGTWQAGATIADKYNAAIKIAQKLDAAEFAHFLRTTVGTSVAANESVVAALLLTQKYGDCDPQTALITAANLGGDTDTIAAIAGAIIGAKYGPKIWGQMPAQISKINHAETGVQEIDTLALKLATLRAESNK